jgi:hypothetical protein
VEQNRTSTCTGGRHCSQQGRGYGAQHTRFVGGVPCEPNNCLEQARLVLLPRHAMMHEDWAKVWGADEGGSTSRMFGASCTQRVTQPVPGV